MAKVRFDKDGNMVNSETGQIIGNTVNGNISINSNTAQLKSLQQMGVSLPDMEEDEQNDFNDQSESKVSEDINNANIFDDKEEKNNKYSSVNIKLTKYEVTPKSFFVISFGLLQQQDGRFIPIQAQKVVQYAYAELHWVKFRMWRYNEELQWKKQCLQFNNNIKCHVMNNDKLNEKKIKNLMLDWSFGQHQDRLKMLHCDGILSDESYKIFMGLYPSIANTIVTLMNNVLENNQ